MKRTFSVSISGRIFNIEEDAYALLLEYLSSLSQVFKGAEGQEIVSDIEGRICEIFSEKQQGGLLVVTRAEVDYVIATVGSPKDIAGGEADDPDETACRGTDTASGAGVCAEEVLPLFYRQGAGRCGKRFVPVCRLEY